jgi:peptide/nickel transport system permease protein
MQSAQTIRLADWRVRHQSTLDEARYNVRVFFKDKLAVLGLAIIIFTMVVAIIGPWIAPYPEQGRGESNLTERLQAPSAKHLMGTDNYGRDVLSRVIYGARIPLVISFVVTSSSACR